MIILKAIMRRILPRFPRGSCIDCCHDIRSKKTNLSLPCIVCGGKIITYESKFLTGYDRSAGLKEHEEK